MDTFAVIVVIAIALAFDFVNGFHDAANSIATVVSTRVLSPRIAVVWAAVFNFVAFLVFGTVVAATIATGVVAPDALSIGVIFAGLIGAIGWNLITFYVGLPTSSSHALVGGIAGAAVAKGGFDVLITSGLRTIGVFIILSPLLGLALGMLLTIAVMWAVHRYRNVDRLNRGFRVGQLFSAAAFSLGHGGNDAQKTMLEDLLGHVVGEQTEIAADRQCARAGLHDIHDSGTRARITTDLGAVAAPSPAGSPAPFRRADRG